LTAAASEKFDAGGKKFVTAAVAEGVGEVVEVGCR
jgi:hypothetical protein